MRTNSYTTAGVEWLCSRFLIAFVLLPFSSEAEALLPKKTGRRALLGGLMLAICTQMIGIIGKPISVRFPDLAICRIYRNFISKNKRQKAYTDDGAGRWPGYNWCRIHRGPPHVWGLGKLLTVVCAFFFALHIIYTDKITKQLNPIAVTSTSFAVLRLVRHCRSNRITNAMVFESAWQEGVIIPLLCLGLFGSLACIQC